MFIYKCKILSIFVWIISSVEKWRIHGNIQMSNFNFNLHTPMKNNQPTKMLFMFHMWSVKCFMFTFNVRERYLRAEKRSSIFLNGFSLSPFATANSKRIRMNKIQRNSTTITEKRHTNSSKLTNTSYLIVVPTCVDAKPVHATNHVQQTFCTSSNCRIEWEMFNDSQTHSLLKVY